MDRAEFLRRKVERRLVQRIFELRRVAVLKINAVIIHAAENVIRRHGFQSAEGVTQGELIEGIFLEKPHKAFFRILTEHAFPRKLGECGKRPAFTVGKFVPRLQNTPNGEAEDHRRHHADERNIFIFYRHHSTSKIRIGNIRTG